MVDISKQSITSNLGERTVTSKVTYVGEMRPDVFISRRTEARMFKTLRQYNWSKSVGARTAALDSLSDSTYSILQSLNTFQAFLSTGSLARSIAARYAWQVGGRLLGKAQGRLLPQGGGPFGRFLRVKGGQVSRNILGKAMKFFIETTFDIKDIPQIKRNVAAELSSASGLGQKWQTLTMVKAMQAAPDFRTGGFGGVQSDKEIEETLGLQKKGSISRNSQFVQKLNAAGFNASEITLLQRIAEEQNLSNTPLDSLKTFGNKLPEALAGGSTNKLVDMGTNWLPMVGKDLDRFVDELGMNLPGGNSGLTFADLARRLSKIEEQQLMYDKIKKDAARSLNSPLMRRLRYENPKEYHKKRQKIMENRDRIAAKKASVEQKDAAATGEDPTTTRPGLEMGTYVDKYGNTRVNLRPRDPNFKDLSEYYEFMEQNLPDGTYKKGKRMTQIVSSNWEDQKSTDNFIPSQSLIAKDIYEMDKAQLDRLSKKTNSAGFLVFGVEFGKKLRDAQQIEFGGPATDRYGTTKYRSDRFVYPASMFMHRSAEAAANQLGIEGKIEFSKAKFGVVQEAKKKADKFSKDMENNAVKKEQSSFKLIFDSSVRENLKQQAIASRNLKYNKNTNSYSSLPTQQIQDTPLNNAMRTHTRLMTRQRLSGVTYTDHVTGERINYKFGDKVMGDYDFTKKFESGLDKLTKEFFRNVNITKMGNTGKGIEEIILKVNKAVGDPGGSGILITDELAALNGMKSRNMFNNRRALDPRIFQNQKFFNGGIRTTDDIYGAVQEMIIEDLQPYYLEALTKISAEETAMVTKLTTKYTRELTGNKKDLIQNTKNDIRLLAENKAKEQAAIWANKQTELLTQQLMNPVDMGALSTGFEVLGVKVEPINVNLYFEKVLNRMTGEMARSGRRNLTTRQMQRSTMIIKEYGDYMRYGSTAKSKFKDRIEKGQKGFNKVFDPVIAGDLKDAVLLELENLRAAGVTDITDVIKQTGYDIVVTEDISQVIVAGGFRPPTTTARGYHGQVVESNKISIPEDSPDTVETYVTRNGKKISTGKRRLSAVETMTRDIQNLRQLINTGRVKALSGLKDIPGTGGTISKSKTNVFGSPTEEKVVSDRRANAKSSPIRSFNHHKAAHEQGSILRKGTAYYAAKILDMKDAPAEYKFDIDDRETRQIIKDYRTVRGQVRNGGGQNMDKVYDGNQVGGGLNPTMKKSLTRLMENANNSAANYNALMFLLALEPDPSIVAYVKYTMNPEINFNYKTTGQSATSKGKNRRLQGQKRANEQTINYYKMRMLPPNQNTAVSWDFDVSMMGGNVNPLEVIRRAILGG